MYFQHINTQEGQVPICAPTRAILKNTVRKLFSAKQKYNANYTYCSPLSTSVWQRYFLAFLCVGQFSKAISKSLMALFRLPLVAYLQQHKSCTGFNNVFPSQRRKSNETSRLTEPHELPKLQHSVDLFPKPCCTHSWPPRGAHPWSNQPLPSR